MPVLRANASSGAEPYLRDLPLDLHLRSPDVVTERGWSVVRLGWCLSGQHVGTVPRHPKGVRCPGRAWNLLCECPCHTDPVTLAADDSLGENLMPPVSQNFLPGGKFGPALPKEPLKLRKRKKTSQ